MDLDKSFSVVAPQCALCKGKIMSRAFCCLHPLGFPRVLEQTSHAPRGEQRSQLLGAHTPEHPAALMCTVWQAGGDMDLVFVAQPPPLTSLYPSVPSVVPEEQQRCFWLLRRAAGRAVGPSALFSR